MMNIKNRIHFVTRLPNRIKNTKSTRRLFSSTSCVYSSRDEYVLTSIYKEIDVPKFTIGEYLFERIYKWPNKIATECGITGRCYTFAELEKKTKNLAACLRSKLNVQNGECIALVLPNIPEYPICLVGSSLAGCVVTTVNPLYTPHEMQHQFETSNVKYIITTPEQLSTVKETLKNMRADNTPVIVVDYNAACPIDGAIKLSQFIEDDAVDKNCLKSVQNNFEDIAVLPFSSGTTGLPKGVMLTHANIVYSCKSIEDNEIVMTYPTTETHQDVFPAILPFYHIFGMVAVMLNQLSLGCKLVTLPTFKPDIFLHTLVKHKTSAMFIVPPIAVFLGKHPAVTAKHLETVRGIVCGAAPLAADDIHAVIQKNPKMIIRQGYGLTETSSVISVAKNHERTYDSVGYILAKSQLKIIRDGVAQPANEEGEILIRGPNVMKGYIGDELNVDCFSTDGYYKTGDIGKYDENKRLYITDRLKELIKIKGYQVSPAEVEGVLRTHNQVLDAAVIGIPSEGGNESVCAFIVPKPGTKVDFEDLKKHVGGKLSQFKVPSRFEIIEAVPRSGAGKILKKELAKIIG